MKKIGLLVLVLVIALGSLGVAYARWSDTVTINGPITTGKVCIEWDAIQEYTDVCPYGNPWYKGPGQGDENLDVAAITGHANGWPNRGVLKYQSYKTDKDAACIDVDWSSGEDQALFTVYTGYPL